MPQRPYRVIEVRSPIQLAGTWFVTLFALVVAFLAAATQAPDSAVWLGPVFGLTAVALVPGCAWVVFRLQTHHRDKLLGDDHYVRILGAIRALPEERHSRISPTAPEQIASRVSRTQELLADARVLWVDDNPDWVTPECQLFREAGIRHIRLVRTTTEALEELRRQSFSVLITDMARLGNPTAGLELIRELPPGSPPVIVYVGMVDRDRGVPAGAFGITDRPDELFNLVLDALEREHIHHPLTS